eukprot:10167660-Alexandrium_andersonii.AAC.1
MHVEHSRGARRGALSEAHGEPLRSSHAEFDRRSNLNSSRAHAEPKWSSCGAPMWSSHVEPSSVEPKWNS